MVSFQQLVCRPGCTCAVLGSLSCLCVSSCPACVPHWCPDQSNGPRQIGLAAIHSDACGVQRVAQVVQEAGCVPSDGDAALAARAAAGADALASLANVQVAAYCGAGDGGQRAGDAFNAAISGSAAETPAGV